MAFTFHLVGIDSGAVVKPKYCLSDKRCILQMEDGNEGKRRNECRENGTRAEKKRGDGVSEKRGEQVCIWCTSYLNMLSVHFIVRK